MLAPFRGSLCCFGLIDLGFRILGHLKRTDRSRLGGRNLSTVTDRPLAVLFEDSACIACDALHDGHLKDPEVDQALSKMAFVRLDALSDTPLIDLQGQKTTARDFAVNLGVTYRPSIVLFDKGKEIARIESMLYRYHWLA